MLQFNNDSTNDKVNQVILRVQEDYDRYFRCFCFDDCGREGKCREQCWLTEECENRARVDYLWKAMAGLN